MASITKRVDGKWRARYRDEAGKEHAKHFGRRVDAQRWLDETLASIVTGIAGAGYSSIPGPNDEKRRLVISMTSSARTMRRRLPGSMRAPAAGSSSSRRP